jgi:hypothetical protein
MKPREEARSWHGREGVGSGARGQTPAGRWRAVGGHGDTEEVARATAMAREVQPAVGGWGGAVTEVLTSGGAAARPGPEWRRPAVVKRG